MCCQRRAAAGAASRNEHGEIGCEPFFQDRSRLVHCLVSPGIPVGCMYHEGLEYLFLIAVNGFRVCGDFVAGGEVLQIEQ